MIIIYNHLYIYFIKANVLFVIQMEISIKEKYKMEIKMGGDCIYMQQETVTKASGKMMYSLDLEKYYILI